MSIYTKFVSPNQLISPVNGYACKRITKQNIRQFGFESIEELHKHYPNFPLLCDETHKKVISGKDSKKHKEHFDKVRAENKEIKKKLLEEEERVYSLSPKKCLKCEQEIPFDKRSWNHCSRACSNSRQWNEEDKLKKSIAAKKHGNKTKKYIKPKTKKSIEVKCACCKRILLVTSSLYRNRKIKIFSCENANCKKVCSNKISSESGKRSAQKRCKRSKQEIELHNLLELHFSNIGSNQPIANGWDADILLHDYKTAILWNGPWHYREMGFSNHSLKQVVNRDCLKIQEFENIGWSVLIYEDRYWTPTEAMIDVLMNTLR